MNFKSWFPYLSAFTVDLLLFACGNSFTWTSPVFLHLRDADPDVNPLGKPIKPTDESWIASLLFLGCTAGPIGAGFLADWLGRKKTLLIIAVPMVIGYAVLGLVTIIELYYVARFILGLGIGSCFAIASIYLAEISEDHNRGLLGCSMTVFLTVGLLCPFAIGPYLSVKAFSLSCTAPVILFFVLFLLFFPESPTYLAVVGDTSKTKDVLKKLRNKSSHEVDKELSEITKALQEERGQKGGVIVILTTSNLRKGLIVSMGLVIIQQFSGINAILAFLGPIFEATGSGISPYVSTVIIGILQVICTILTAALVEKLGRRLLLLFSTIGSCVSIILVGIYFYLKDHQHDVTSIFWLPVGGCILYVICFNAGLAPLPWTMMGELFPAYAKSVASTITTCSCFISSFTVTLTFPILQEKAGNSQCFFIYGAFCLLGAIFCYFRVPETKGKSLAEIQRILSGKQGDI